MYFLAKEATWSINGNQRYMETLTIAFSSDVINHDMDTVEFPQLSVGRNELIKSKATVTLYCYANSKIKALSH